MARGVCGANVMAAGLWVCAVMAQGQSVPSAPASLAVTYDRGPHTCGADRAVVGLEVTSVGAGGGQEETRRASGLLVRCDGFVLAPSSLFPGSISAGGRAEAVGRVAVRVYLHPGTAEEIVVAGRRPRTFARGVPCVVVKLDGVHASACRLLLPDRLTEGTPVTAAWTAWDPARARFSPPLSAAGRLVREAGAEGFPDLRLEGADRVPEAGAVVVGAEGTAVGLVAGGKAGVPAVVSMGAFGLMSNCVTPLSALPSAAEAEETDRSGMVAVPGGALAVPGFVLEQQPDMEKARLACVAPFHIDRTEVTNADYLAYWTALPEADRRRLGFRIARFPLCWSSADPPFPSELASLPVLGVPLTGAMEYARWRGKRLPTPYEWVMAALGGRGEANTPEWMLRYSAERQALWLRARELHVRYQGTHPELGAPDALYPSHYRIPWIGRTGLQAAATAWSRQTALALVERISQVWMDPQIVMPVGARAYDVSPCGAQDMLLNAAELVAPPPTRPPGRASSYMETLIDPLEQPKGDAWWVRPVEALTDARGLPPLSRLYRRSISGPSTELLIARSGLAEASQLLIPIAGFHLRWGSETEQTAVMFPAGVRGQYGVVSAPTGLEPWAGSLPSRFRREMGRATPLDTVDGHSAVGPQLYYYLPVGFRCAR